MFEGGLYEVNWRRPVGIVFQAYDLYDWMTVSENVSFPLLARGERKAERLAASPVASYASWGWRITP